MRLLPLVVVCCAGPAAADTTYMVTVSNRVTPAQPSATVEVRAVFEEDLFAFAGAKFGFFAPADAGGFSDPHRVLDDPGTQDGEVSPDGDSVEGIVAGQLYFPIIEWPIDKSNPILIWQVTWSTDDFRPRSVDIETSSSGFWLYIDALGTSQDWIGSLVEGSGLIEVGCFADCTGDGALDLFDFLCFVNRFNAGDPSTDCDGTGSLDLFDFLCFVNAFNAGC
jgi:hypothetical protein